MKKQRRVSLVGYCLLALVFLMTGAAQLSAQALYGSLYGNVLDATGAAIPGATVTVTDIQKGTQQVVTSGPDGGWRVDRLIPDTYKVKVEAPNFSPTESQPVDVHADSAQKVDLTVGLQATATTINVTTEAPALKTDKADVATVLDQTTIANVPNFTRNFTNFLLLTPGVQHSSFNIAGPENPQGGIALNSNGSNYGEQGFILDGTDNRDPVLGIIVINPTLDSIAETKVITQNYDAEFGGAAGGIVNVTTKSGGNDLHGDAFFFRHSDYFYARNPFTQYQADPVSNRFVPSELYSQFGGALSGPIIKDKAFFFLDYQGLRQRLGSTLQQNVPTALLRSTCLASSGNCNLSQYTSQVLYNPVTKTPYSSTPGQIPVSSLSPQAVNLLRLIPAANANGTSTTNNYVASGNGVLNGDQADVRLDHQATQNLHLFGRYDYALFRLTGVPVFGAAGGQGFGLQNTSGLTNTQNQSATAGLDWALSPSLATDLRFGFLSYHVAESKYPGQVSADTLGIPNLNVAADTGGAPTFNFNQGGFSGLGNQGCNCPLLQSEQVFQLVNNWTKTRGNHTIRFGADLRYAKNVRNASDFNRSGQFIFDNSSTGLGGSGGSDVASFLVGYAARFQRFDVFINDQYSYQKRLAFYAQDNWRVTPKLTVNYGVRWDLIFPEAVNGLGHGGFASLEAGGIRVAGANGIGTNGNQRMDYTNLAGRLGIAYQLHPNTVVRAGAGMTYDTVGYFGTLFGSVLSHNLPVQGNEDVNRTGNYAANQYAATLAAPPARPTPFTIPTTGIIPFQDKYAQQFRGDRITLPRVFQYNVAIQQQFGSKTTAEIAYVGNIGDRVYPGETFGYDLNSPSLPTSAAQLAAGNTLRRPYYNRFSGVYQGQVVTCCSSGMTSAQPNGRAIYNALQTKVTQHLSNGLSFNANYTWSKAMNYANDAAFAQYKRASWGRNDTNREHIFVLSGVYELPFGKNRMLFSKVSRPVDYVIGGWSLSGQSTWESGRPFTPTYAECASDQDLDTGFASPGTTSLCRPNGNASAFPLSVGSFDTSSHSRRYFTPVAALTTNGAVSGPFSRPQFGQFGNIGRLSMVGPRDFFADASLIKDFPITERVKGQFQFQAFNVFNHAALDIPTATYGRCVDCSASTQSTAGTITSLEPNSTMRRLQFAARLQF